VAARFLIYLAVLVALIGAVTLGELDEILKARHPPGGASYGMADLSGSLFSPDLNQLDEVVAGTWLNGRPEEFTNPVKVAQLYIRVDVAFAIAYASLLLILALVLRRKLKAASDPASLSEVADHRLAGRGIAVDEYSRKEELADLEPRVATYRRLAFLAIPAAVAVLAADLAESYLQWTALEEPSRLLAGALYGVTLAKWALLALVVVGLLLGLVGLDLVHPRARGGFLATLVVARAPLLLAGLLVVAFLTDATPFGEQASDVLLGWNENRADAAVAIVLFAWLSALTLVLARRLLEPTPETRQAMAWSEKAELVLGRPAPIDLRKRPHPVVVFVLGLVLAVCAYVLHRSGAGGAGVWVAAGILLAVPVASWLIGKVEPGPLPVLGAGTLTLPALAAATPLVVLGLALVQATVAEVAWARRDAYLWWTLLGAILAIAGLVVFAVARSGRSQWLVDRAWIVVAPTIALLVFVVWRIWMHPWRTADALGAFGVFAAAAGAALLVAYLLMWPEERLRPPSVFAVVCLRRIPVFALVALWSLVAAFLDQGGFHDVRPHAAGGTLRPGGVDKERGLTVDAAFSRWLRQNPAPGSADGGQRAHPLVLVAAAGGGVRAAYWTGLVLECVFAGRGADACETPASPRPEASVFAAAGASGGSVGLANWLARLRTGDDDWLDDLGDDSLSPTLAWALFVDMPNSLVRLHGFADRAEVLERTWEQQWGDRDSGLGDLVLPWRRGPASGGALAEGLFEASSDDRIPLLLLSSTSVEDGCRFAVSVLDSNVGGQRVGTPIEDCLSMRSFESTGPKDRLEWALAASKDLDDYLCENGDLRLSTAALLSARFPYVSPSGRLVKCDDETGDSATYLVDGGYYDNTGASPLVELWAAVEPLVTRFNRDGSGCIAPFVLEIDNHYGEDPGPEPDPRPKESQVPLQTLLGTRGAQEANARQSLAVGVSVPFADDRVVVHRDRPDVLADRYARIFPRAHPGTRAPLGWTLSKAARNDLLRELRSDRNAPEIEKARRWLSDELVCAETPRPSPDSGEDGTN
jgi:hypothetical protein